MVPVSIRTINPGGPSPASPASCPRRRSRSSGYYNGHAVTGTLEVRRSRSNSYRASIASPTIATGPTFCGPIFQKPASKAAPGSGERGARGSGPGDHSSRGAGRAKATGPTPRPTAMTSGMGGTVVPTAASRRRHPSATTRSRRTATGSKGSAPTVGLTSGARGVTPVSRA